MNYLEIPTTFKHGTMEIKLGGTVNLELTVETTSKWWSVYNLNVITLVSDRTAGPERKPNGLLL